MKQIFLFLLFGVFSISAFAVGTVPKKQLQKTTEKSEFTVNSEMEAFLTLTPKKYHEMTGKRLGIKGSLELKAAQRMLKKHAKGGASDIPKGLYIIGAIFGFSWILMGVMDDWEGDNWWVTLLLYCACGLPGLIYSFVKMKDYY